MTEDQANYLSGVANVVGIVNWAIIDYKPEGALEHVRGFRFEGMGNLPRFKERISPVLYERFKANVREADNVVYNY